MAAGEHTINYAELAQQEKMSEIQLRIRQLLNQVDQILKEQNYQRVSLIHSNQSNIGRENVAFAKGLFTLLREYVCRF